MMMDVNIMDLIWQNHADEPEVARGLAGWKDDHVNPIMDRRRRLLEATKNKVICGTFDPVGFQTAAEALQNSREKHSALP
jgi:hypothetical protein